MRILLVTIGTLIFVFIGFLSVKLWGRGQVYAEYPHPLFNYQAQQKSALMFYKYAPEKIKAALETNENLYLDVASTDDGRAVVATVPWTEKMKPLRFSTSQEVKDKILFLTDLKDKLASRKLILNLSENAQAGHAIFFEELKKMGFEKGANFIVMSPYEPMAKALKEIAPTLVYGTTQPEILRILAMKSMGLIEAVNFRADVIVQPLLIRNREFYDQTLLDEMARRHRKIVVGPIAEEQLQQAQKLSPFGILIDRK